MKKKIFLFFLLVHLLDANAATAFTIAQAQLIKTKPEKQHLERLNILNQERNDIVDKIKKAKINDDKENLARSQTDLELIDREINTISRQSLDKKSNITKPVSEKPVVTETTIKTQFEDWDIFKNFGRGN